MVIRYLAGLCIENIKEEAFSHGFISDINLAYLLTGDEQYTVDQVTQIWSDFDMPVKNAFKPDFSTSEKIAMSWFKLIQRMMTKGLAGIETFIQRTPLQGDKECSATGIFSKTENLDKFIYVDFDFQEIAEYFQHDLGLDKPWFCSEYEIYCLPSEHKYQKPKRYAESGKEDISNDLDLDRLKIFAGGLLNTYAKTELFIERISVCQIKIPPFLMRNKSWDKQLKYGVIFYCPTYSGEDTRLYVDDFGNMEVGNFPLSDYQVLIDDIEKSNSQEDSIFPLFSGHFEVVYKKNIPQNFKNNWQFCIKGNETKLPFYFDLDTEITLYPEISIDKTDIEFEPSDAKLEQTSKNNDPQAWSFKSNHEGANRDTPVQNIDHSRSFVLKGDRWDITFDGETIILNNIKPIRYLLEALKNPKKDIPYSTIVDIVSGSNQTHKTNKRYSEMAKDKENERLEEDGLTEKSNAEMDCLYTEEEVKEIFKNLEEQYLKLKDGTQKEKDGLKEAMRYFERVYCHRVITTKDSIKMGKKTSPSKRAKDDSSLVRNSIKGVMERLKGKSLHRHLELYLHIKNGVKYDPPEDQPLWEIKDT